MTPSEDITIQKTVLIRHSLKELYSIWRNFENFIALFDFLENVLIIDPTHSRWTAKVSDQNERLVWDVEITREQINELIEWHSFSNTDILHEGVVRFLHQDSLKGILVSLQLRFYFPLLHDSAYNKANMLGNDFETRLQDNLTRFKQSIEANQFPQLPRRERHENLPDGFPTNEGPWKNFT